MCEYCCDTTFKRNKYIIKGNDDYMFEGSLSLDDLDNNLLLECSYVIETSPKERIPMGLGAKFFVRYCPWCGRKLNDEK